MYVLIGNVREAENKVRITAQLVDAKTGIYIWAERNDKDLKDIFAIQDEITKEIITSLQIELTEGEAARIYSKGSDNLDAYLKVMQANWHALQHNREDILKAQIFDNEVIDLDP